MSGVKLLPRLSFDQISHAPRGPEGSAVTKGFRTFFQSLAQLLQLGWLQAGLAACPCRFTQRLGSLFFPRLMPTADRLAVNAQPSSNLPLMEASIKKPGSFEPSSFELIKITFDTFGIAHAQILARRIPCVTLFCDSQ
jgi:hypothetical protein